MRRLRNSGPGVAVYFATSCSAFARRAWLIVAAVVIVATNWMADRAIAIDEFRGPDAKNYGFDYHTGQPNTLTMPSWLAWVSVVVAAVGFVAYLRARRRWAKTRRS